MHAHGLRFDGDPTFAFDVHVVKELALHTRGATITGILQHAVCKSGFAMVNMCDDTKVPNNRWIGRTGLRRAGRHCDTCTILLVYIGCWSNRLQHN